MNYLKTCYPKHTSYITTHIRKALYSQVYVILMLLLGSHICLIKNGQIELICRCDYNVHYYNLEHSILYEFNN